MARVAIFDYGAGNIFSLKTSLERAGASVDVISEIQDCGGSSGLLLPGVGNFDPAMRRFGGTARDVFLEYAGNMPVLGICLGMEMFFERSEEGSERGLGVIGGDVVVLPPSMKVPHMGWNSLDIRRPGVLLDGVPDGAWAYFVHSYRTRPGSGDVVTSESDYGIRVPATVEHGNFFGTQFHPEKSGAAGRAMLANFIRECSR